MLFLRLVYVYFLNLFLYQLNAYEYCNNGLGKKLCGDLKHFLCDETEVTASFKYVYPPITDWTDHMLDWHNIYRNMVASGKVENNKSETFPSASRMRVLLWDHELAYLSYMHVSRCNATKADCHKTKKFKNAGENFGRVTLSMNSTALKVLEQNINAWFMLKDKLQGDDMKLVPEKLFANVEHFMVLVNDEVSKVGCAMAFCTDCDKKNDQFKYCYYITCHYNFGALANYRIYKDGEPASDCAYWGTEPSKSYTSLCDNSGKDFSDLECSGGEKVDCKRDGVNADEWSAAKAGGPQPKSPGTYEYCTNGVGDRICKDTHHRHFTCDDTQVEQVGTCEKIFPTDGIWRAAMLDRHNELRDKMASGTETNGKGEIFPAAGRMRVLVWDDELAYLSKMHVKKCNMTHSICHRCPRFLKAGQNLAFQFGAAPMKDMFKLLKTQIDYWYDEKHLLTGQELRIYPDARFHDVGHIMVQVNDEVSKVGCAFAYCKNCKPGNPYCYFTTCHYDFAAYGDTRIYFVADKPASDCAYWDSVPDTKYKNLCKNTGIDFPTEECRMGKSGNRECFRNNVPIDAWKHP